MTLRDQYHRTLDALTTARERFIVLSGNPVFTDLSATEEDVDAAYTEMTTAYKVFAALRVKADQVFQ